MFRKFRSAKCCAANRPIPTWSLVTRATCMSGLLIVTSTTGIPRFMSVRTAATDSVSDLSAATIPSPFHASGR